MVFASFDGDSFEVFNQILIELLTVIFYLLGLQPGIFCPAVTYWEFVSLWEKNGFRHLVAYTFNILWFNFGLGVKFWIIATLENVKSWFIVSETVT
jgi:hypothetical protein